MKTEVILGKEGNQKFPIKSPDVSRLHARITVQDGVWTLEDLGSTNGTFLQIANGSYIQVKKKEINEFSRISLGSTTAMGYTFLAHHILEENPADYRAEMQYIINLNKQLQQKYEDIEKNERRNLLVRNIPTLIVALFGVVCFFLFPPYRMLVIIFGSAVSALSGFYFTATNKSPKKKKQFKEYKDALIRCPHCNKILTNSELQNQMCICHAHA